MSHLSVLQRTELSKLIQEFPSLFGDVPSQTHLIEHDVDVGDVSPIRQRFYCVSFKKRLKLESEIWYMLENNIVKPSDSSWPSPCLLVRKHDDAFRVCTDCRKLNKSQNLMLFHSREWRIVMIKCDRRNMSVNSIYLKGTCRCR